MNKLLKFFPGGINSEKFLHPLFLCGYKNGIAQYEGTKPEHKPTSK